jgi:hypothetical protein
MHYIPHFVILTLFEDCHSGLGLKDRTSENILVLINVLNKFRFVTEVQSLHSILRNGALH